MNEKRTAGGDSRLEIDIDEKAFRAADGQTVAVLRDLSFDVKDGAFTCLIGPSGCGKTTTLRLILGLDRDFRGAIRHANGDGRMAAVFQEPRLLPWRTVEQNVRLVLPAGAENRDLGRLFSDLGLDDKQNSYPGELSLGLARRAALARAFAVEPELILLDEPFVSLDAETAARLRRLLITVWQSRPTTVLMVTHNLREAAELADRIVFLSPRPANIRGEYAVKLPRAERDSSYIDQCLAEIEARFPGTVEGAGC